MFELWKMKAKVEMYLKLLENEPEEIKKELGVYIKDVILLEKELNRYISKLDKELIKWDLRRIDLKKEDDDHLLVMIKMAVTAYKLNRIYTNRGMAILLKQNVNQLKNRMNQFTYFKRP